MRIYLTAAVVLGLLAGCSSEQGSPAGKATASASNPHRDQASLPFAARSTMSSFASLPDRGELLAYEQGRITKRSGAYTAYPVGISEAHALQAMQSGEMVVKAPNGELVRLKYERHEESADGNWSWIGRDANGNDAVITFGEKAVFGSIPQGDGETLRLTMSAGQSWLVQTDRSKLAGLDGAKGRQGGDHFTPPKLSTAAGMPSVAAMQAQSAPATAGASATTSVIDVLLGYTNGFASKLGSDSAAVTRLNNLVAITNQAYQNSGINMRVRLVKVVKVNYADNTDNGEALEKLSGYEAGEDGGSIPTDPAFDELRAARDESGADLVSLVRAFSTPENNGCGIAWLIGGDGAGITAADAPFGYSVVSDGTDLDEDDDYTYYCRDETLAHELGHNMGQAHNEEDSDSAGVHPYSYGYRESSSTGFYTVMAYPQTDGSQSGIRYFANPSIKYNGRATGVADQSDNVRSMNITMPTVATFRATVVPIEGQRPNLYIIKRNGSSGRTEVHILKESDSYNTYLQQSATKLAKTGTAGDWVFRTGDYNGDGTPDLFVIKKNGSSNHTEVHILNGANRFQSYLLQAATPLGKTGSDAAWDFQLGDYNGDGRPDIYAIKRTGSSAGKTEVHILSGASKYKTYLLRTATKLGQTGSDLSWKFLVGHANTDSKPDIYAIKRNGSSGRTEVHVLNGANKFQSYVFQKATALPKSGTNNDWEFALGDYDEDGTTDLYVIKKAGSSGKTELHVLSGVGYFQNYLFHKATRLPATGTSGGWQFVTP
jgi:peptidyl-Asp metalloendopeptidase